MLYIIDRIGSTETQNIWHIGKPLPPIKGRVVTFQADGDELDLILEVLKLGSRSK